MDCKDVKQRAPRDATKSTAPLSLIIRSFMDSFTLASLGIVYVSIIALMAPFEAQALRRESMQLGRKLGWLPALLFGLYSIALSVTTFVVVFASIGLGIPYLLGNMVGLPWLTSLPGLALGFFAARAANKRLTAFLLNSRHTNA